MLLGDFSSSLMGKFLSQHTSTTHEDGSLKAAEIVGVLIHPSVAQPYFFGSHTTKLAESSFFVLLIQYSRKLPLLEFRYSLSCASSFINLALSPIIMSRFNDKICSEVLLCCLGLLGLSVFETESILGVSLPSPLCVIQTDGMLWGGHFFSLLRGPTDYCQTLAFGLC